MHGRVSPGVRLGISHPGGLVPALVDADERTKGITRNRLCVCRRPGINPDENKNGKTRGFRHDPSNAHTSHVSARHSPAT